MTLFKRLSALLLAALLVSACAGTPKKESTGEYLDDSLITTKVKTAILNEPMLKVNQITVETYKGVVQLSGFVDSAAAKTAAGSVAQNVAGVSKVTNNLQVGADRTSIGSDLGQVNNPVPIDAFKKLLSGLHDLGVSERDLGKLVRDNPARLLGLN